eukprot:15172747-Alexandrium_andersonii.AAC.1
MCIRDSEAHSPPCSLQAAAAAPSRGGSPLRPSPKRQRSEQRPAAATAAKGASARAAPSPHGE